MESTRRLYVPTHARHASRKNVLPRLVFLVERGLQLARNVYDIGFTAWIA